ncbi:MAG: S-methyl-5-thioribose-1-phosphate isomerase [Armatimonadota bacterium]|nr:S-methyl-5-thioribose-1-phosphate isomerase [bacterium]
MQRTVDYINGKVIMIDQTRIPAELSTIELASYQEVAEAITSMKVRGAPAIGVTGALGIAVAARQSEVDDPQELYAELEHASDVLRATRPTAVNLFWGIDRMMDAAHAALQVGSSVDDIRDALDGLAHVMLEEDEETCQAIGAHGAELIPDGARVLTHCNAGALACVGYGTALGVIRAAVDAGKKVMVYADETRPRLQGMKLTCFELLSDNIPVTVISDNMAGSFMRKGEIDCVVVGADRIAANGDAANKIGTYSVAILAHHHGIPFYVAAPMSTVDFSLSSGDDIPIEERPHEEVTHIDGQRIAPEGVRVVNPSFDVTPAAYITAIITEKGIVYPPYRKNLRA